VIIQLSFSQVPEKWERIVGSAYLNNHSYDVLKRICDEAGGRLVGSPQNEKAMKILIEELRALGIKPRKEIFTIPGWIRGNDQVKLVYPSERIIKAYALGYTENKPAFEATVVNGNLGYTSDLSSEKVRGKIVFIQSKRNARPAPPLRYQIIQMAADSGARGILFMNSQPGTLVRAGTGNFQGTPTAIPAYTIPYEEGARIARLLKNNKTVKIFMDTRSYCKEVKTANVVVTFPGKSKEKIVLGAHFDSWDLGQGAIDNGIGSAILFDIARLIHQFSPKNLYTIELVWFNGEELGLWGSKRYVEMHSRDDMILMINMDMTGLAYGFDVMGFIEAKPYFINLAEKMAGMDFSTDIAEFPWTNSDHMPFMFKGIPVLTFRAKLDPEQSKYYHSMGDTFDKVKKNYLSHSAAAIAITTIQLANEKEFPFEKYSIQKVKEMMEKYGIDKRLKKQGEWIFDKSEK
jgi:Zn-dependent M28 family amino/carboxypeptidase